VRHWESSEWRAGWREGINEGMMGGAILGVVFTGLVYAIVSYL